MTGLGKMNGANTAICTMWNMILRKEQKVAYSGLRQILQLADLVKFAKWDATPDEHELSLMNAYLFVNKTKVEETKPLEEIKTDEIKETN